MCNLIRRHSTSIHCYSLLQMLCWRLCSKLYSCAHFTNAQHNPGIPDEQLKCAAHQQHRRQARAYITTPHINPIHQSYTSTCTFCRIVCARVCTSLSRGCKKHTHSPNGEHTNAHTNTRTRLQAVCLHRHLYHDWETLRMHAGVTNHRAVVLLIKPSQQNVYAMYIWMRMNVLELRHAALASLSTSS